jgi:predicted MPP superfamily phosphohydrolase
MSVPGLRFPKARRSRAALALAVFAACAVDALWIEPNWIEVTHYAVPAAVSEPLKIAHLSDLHTKGMGFRERRLLELLEREKPDVIVVTGDTISSSGTYERESHLLRNLHAPLGVWLVRGNWENWYALRNEPEFYRANGAQFLLNRSAELKPGVWLVGLNDTAFAQADVEKAFANIPPDAYRIALFHGPAFFSGSAGRYSLGLAGHSHGGQVRLPLLPPLWLPAGVGPYVHGWFAAGGSRMYVSRGIGTTLLPIRFFCRPELPIITLEPLAK